MTSPFRSLPRPARVQASRAPPRNQKQETALRGTATTTGTNWTENAVRPAVMTFCLPWQGRGCGFHEIRTVLATRVPGHPGIRYLT
eukprot:522675-Rhodomonas_salina.1